LPTGAFNDETMGEVVSKLVARSAFVVMGSSTREWARIEVVVGVASLAHGRRLA
jgi:hypothetical protein